MKLELVATATFGLEAVVRREIEALGYKIIKTEDGRVTYMGDERAIEPLQSFLSLSDLTYLDYIELRNAIEALGGECPEREFDAQDPAYEAMCKMQ